MATNDEVPVEIKQSRVCATENSVSFMEWNYFGEVTEGSIFNGIL